MKKYTLAKSFEVKGVGVHSGSSCYIKVEPFDEGVVFVLEDFSKKEIRATVENVVDTRFSVVLGSEGVSVKTVEHLLSSFMGMGVDAALVRVWGGEIPIMDGSSLVFVKKIKEAGLKPLSGSRSFIKPVSPVWVKKNDSYLVVFPADVFSVTYTIDFPVPGLRNKRVSFLIDSSVYAKEIAPARTFGFLQDAEKLRKMGLSKGSSLRNVLVYDRFGPLFPLRLPNEAVRHKVLDLLGDLFLAGGFLKAHVVAYKAGHSLDIELAKMLKKGIYPKQAPPFPVLIPEI